MSKNFSIKYSVLYNIDPNATAENTSQTGQPSDYRRKLLRLPYSYDAESIQILKSGEEIYSLNIPDRVCKSNDNTCPEYCKEKGIDSDCETQKVEKGFLAKLFSWFTDLI